MCLQFFGCLVPPSLLVWYLYYHCRPATPPCMSRVTACAKYLHFSHTHTHTHIHTVPTNLILLQYNMIAENTALLGDWHRPSTHPEESIHLRPNYPTINCDSKPETSHLRTSVLSQGTDYTMLTGALNTVDIYDLMDTLDHQLPDSYHIRMAGGEIPGNYHDLWLERWSYMP